MNTFSSSSITNKSSSLLRQHWFVLLQCALINMIPHICYLIINRDIKLLLHPPLALIIGITITRSITTLISLLLWNRKSASLSDMCNFKKHTIFFLRYLMINLAITLADMYWLNQLAKAIPVTYGLTHYFITYAYLDYAEYPSHSIIHSLNNAYRIIIGAPFKFILCHLQMIILYGVMCIGISLLTVLGQEMNIRILDILGNALIGTISTFVAISIYKGFSEEFARK